MYEKKKSHRPELEKILYAREKQVKSGYRATTKKENRQKKKKNNNRSNISKVGTSSSSQIHI